MMADSRRPYGRPENYARTMIASLPGAAAFAPADMPWDTTHADGTRSATLVGSRGPGEMFSYAFFLPAGVDDGPHSHSAAAHLHVAAGALRLGYGPVLDRGAARSYRSGSFLHVPAGAVHFDGAEVDTVIIGTAIGPWSTDYV